MKRVFCFMFLLAIHVSAYSGPVLAADDLLNDFGVIDEKNTNNECLLVAINCGSDYLSLEEIIDKLQLELSKGRSVYTDDELRILKEKLDNAKKTLEFYNNEGASNSY